MADNSRQFASATRKAATTETVGSDLPDFVIIPLAGRDIALSRPGTGQLTYLASISASDDDDALKWGGIINFLVALMDDDDGRFLKRALMSNELEVDEIAEAVEDILEKWSDRPTMRSSGSSPQRRATGRPSTGASRRQGSSRSTSRSAGS